MIARVLGFVSLVYFFEGFMSVMQCGKYTIHGDVVGVRQQHGGEFIDETCTQRSAPCELEV